MQKDKSKKVLSKGCDLWLSYDENKAKICNRQIFRKKCYQFKNMNYYIENEKKIFLIKNL